MPNGIFANQFNYANAYNPVGLDTGAISVGATLGKRPPREKTPSENEPSRVPTSNKETANTAAGATAGMSQAAVGGIGAGAMVGAGNAAANQGTMNKLAHMEQSFGGGQQTTPSTNYSAMIDMPKQSGAQVNHPAPSSGGGGFWSSLGHDIASGVSDVGHVLNSPVVHNIMSFGDPLSGIDGSKNGTGGVMGLMNQQQASNVIKPTSVYNPTRAPSPELPSGSPNIIQGSVENPGNVGQGTFKALSRGTGYDNMNLGPQFYNKPASTVSRLSSAASDTPWYDSIPSDLSTLGEDVLSGVF